MLSAVVWWLIAELIGLAAWPLTWRLFAHLPSRGYGLSKLAGLLVSAFILWWGATLGIVANGVGGAIVSVVLMGAISAWVARDALRRGRSDDGVSPLVDWMREHRRLIWSIELLFAVVFVLWSVFRAYNPDISGTEKPMEFAFINGVLGSPLFPPQDPWLSGYGISYYYFGYVMLSLLIRLTGTLPEFGFNLGVSLWYALVLLGAFSVVFDLVRMRLRPEDGSRDSTGVRSADSRAIRYGLLGSAFLGVIGNLEGLVELAYNRGLVPAAWIQWLDIKQLTDAAPTGGWSGGFWWWWRASRVIHDKDLLGNTIEVIDEFPLFSFLLGDLHPHVLGLPFVLMAIALALNLMVAVARRIEVAVPGEPQEAKPVWVQAGGALRRFWQEAGDTLGTGGWGVVAYGVVLGGLGFLNTWDFPIYLALLMLAVGMGMALREGLTTRVVLVALGTGACLGVLGFLLYLPFYVGFRSQLGGILPNLLFPSRFSQYLLMFGPFLLLAVSTLILSTLLVGARKVLRRFGQTLPWTVLLPIATFGLFYVALTRLPAGKTYLDSLMQDAAVQANIGGRTIGELAALVVRVRLTTPWTFLFLALVIAWVIALLLAWIDGRDRVQESNSGTSPAIGYRAVTDAFVISMLFLGFLLTLVVEFVYLRDLFGSRMNTVFKLYYQAWVLLALAGAYGVSLVFERPTPRLHKVIFGGLTAVLVAGCLYYPVAAIPSKADQFRGTATLDGLAYLERSSPGDMAAIRWIRENVAPQDVVVEASGGSYSVDGAGRVSMSAGNPTLLGWDFHEMQWRGQAYNSLVAGRPEALDQIYRTARAEELPGLLDRWEVKYVYVGQLERSKYGIGDAALGRFDDALLLVYDQLGVRIYAR